MGFPVHDWQFWVATLGAVVSLGWLLRNVLPVPFFSGRARRKRRSKSVSLTISAPHKPARHEHDH